MDCLENIIGITQSDCPCFDEKPVGSGTSDSGLYFDELEGINLTELLHDGACRSIWDKITNSIASAKNHFVSDLLACYSTKIEQSKEPFKGVIGDGKFNRTLTNPLMYSGLRLRPKRIKEGVIKINKITTYFDTTDTIDIDVYSSEDLTTPITTRTLNTTANKANTNTITTIELPLYSDTYEELDYYLVYSGTPKPLNVKAKGCGCGGKKDLWSPWVYASGFNSSTITELNDKGTNNHAMGLLVHAEITCDQSNLICNEDFSYFAGSFGFRTANAIRYKAASLLFETLLSNPELSQHVAIQPERMTQLADQYRTEYEARVMYLCENYKLESDCFTCKRNLNKGFLRK